MKASEKPPTSLYEARCLPLEIVVPFTISGTANFGSLVDNDCPVFFGKKCSFFKELKWTRDLSPDEVVHPGNKNHETKKSSFDIFKSQCPLEVFNLFCLVSKSMQNCRQATELMQQANVELDQKMKKARLEKALHLLKVALVIEEKVGNSPQDVSFVERDLADALEQLARIPEISPADREQYLEEGRNRIERALEIGQQYLGYEKLTAMKAVKKRLCS